MFSYTNITDVNCTYTSSDHLVKKNKRKNFSLSYQKLDGDFLFNDDE